MYMTSVKCKRGKNKWTVKFRLTPDAKTGQQNRVRKRM